jgi:hypothetical protein
MKVPINEKPPFGGNFTARFQEITAIGQLLSLLLSIVRKETLEIIAGISG